MTAHRPGCRLVATGCPAAIDSNRMPHRWPATKLTAYIGRTTSPGYNGFCPNNETELESITEHAPVSAIQPSPIPKIYSEMAVQWSESVRGSTKCDFGEETADAAKIVVLYGSDRLSIQWSKWIGVTRSHSSTVDVDQQQQCICIQDTQKYRAFRLLSLVFREHP